MKLTQLSVVAVIVIGSFSNLGWGEAIRFIPNNKPFFKPAKFGHIVLNASGKEVRVKTDHVTFIHTEDKGWCVEDNQRNRACYNQLPVGQISITEDSSGATVGHAGLKKDRLWVSRTAEDGMLTFDYTKNLGYPNNGRPYTVTRVSYSGPNGSAGQLRYVQKSDAVYRCVSPVKDENFLRSHSVKHSGCH